MIRGVLVLAAACGRIGENPTHFEYVATVATCLNPSAPDLTSCQARKGQTELVIDQSDPTTMKPWYSYLRFDLDGALAGRTVASVVLRAVATDAADAMSNMSGEVHAVSAFSEQDLATTVPTKLTKLASDQGAVTQLQIVTWSIPDANPAPNASIYLGIYPISGDGVHYWNLLGTEPPRLVIDAR